MDIFSELHSYIENIIKNDVPLVERKAINPATGKEMTVYFPEFYSQNAVNIIASKYFSKDEVSLDQLINRVVKTIALWAVAQGYLNIDKDKYVGEIDIQLIKERPYDYFHIAEKAMQENKELNVFITTLSILLKYQYASFNSPVWFNLGNPYNKQQVSACFIDNIEDTLESIAKSAYTWYMVFRGGSGIGVNRSNLRSSKEFLSGGGKSSGPNSFAKVGDIIGSVTKSGGKTRRAAIMEILNIDHPDVIEFITQKRDEERKAKALIKAGYSADFDDPKGAYGSVFFQNSNQSVRLTDTFINAFVNNEKWHLLARYPSYTREKDKEIIINGKVVPKVGEFHISYFCSQGAVCTIEGEDGKLFVDNGNGLMYEVIETVNAQDLMDLIAECAWETGDPGVQFHDNINKYNTCSHEGEIVASNPCSEYMFLNSTSCNLASINLLKFINIENGDFHYGFFEYCVRTMITAMDILVDMAYYPTAEIEAATRKYRTLGLGYTNLGAALMALQYPYDSDAARLFAAAVTALMHAAALDQSSILGKEMGAFPAYKNEPYKKVINRHLESLKELQLNYSGYKQVISRAYSLLLPLAVNDDYLMRNAQVTLIAPTGTISLAMDCETTGIEPYFSFDVYKKLVGGGTMSFTFPTVEKVMKSLGIASIEEAENHKEYANLFKTAVGSNSLSPEAHLKMMAAIQPFLSGAISKTVNLPKNITISEIENIYLLAHKLNLKAIAIYRDGSKSTQPLNKSNDDEGVALDEGNKQQGKTIKPVIDRKRMPQDASAIRSKFTVGGVEGYIHVGLYEDGKPGEIFIRTSKQGSTINGIFEVWALTLSIALQYGVPLEVFIEKFKNIKFEPYGVTDSQYQDLRFANSIPDYVARWLEHKFIKENGKIAVNKVESIKTEVPAIEEKVAYDGTICTLCGGLIIRTGTCGVCTSCGESSGCG